MTVLYVVLAAIAAFVVVVALRPSEFRVERSAVVNGAPPKVFEKVNDLRNWNAWSPWAVLDPAAKYEYGGPPAGEGASLAWAGNKEVGEGKMTVIESRPNELVKFRLEFLKPFTATNTAEFTFVPEGAGTRVSWAMFGTSGFMFKAVGLFMNCDKMCGDQFEKGLARLNTLVESAPSSGDRFASASA